MGVFNRRTQQLIVVLATTALLQLSAVSHLSVGAEAKGSGSVSRAASISKLKFGWGSTYRSRKVTTVGRRISIRGRVLVDGKPVHGAVVKIKRRARAPGSEWESLEDAITDSRGKFSRSVEGVPSSTFTATYNDMTTSKSMKKSARLFVRPKVVFNVFPRRLHNKKRIVLKGKLVIKVGEVSPKGKNVTIKFRDTSSGSVRWRAFSVRKADKNGEFRATHRFLRVKKPTRFRFRADVPGEFAWPFATGRSRAVSVVVLP